MAAQRAGRRAGSRTQEWYGDPAGAAPLALLVGGIAAVGVLLTRWQAIHLLDVVWFYRLLTVHGMNMLIFFILFFEMAVLYFSSAV